MLNRQTGGSKCRLRIFFQLSQNPIITDQQLQQDIQPPGDSLLKLHSRRNSLLTTTSDFAPRLLEDSRLAEALPTRIELVNGAALRKWLNDLVRKPW